MPICSAGHPSSSVDYCELRRRLSLDPDAPSEPGRWCASQTAALR